MKLRFVWVGKTKRAAIRGMVEDYLERVRKFARVEVVELRDRDDIGADRRKIIEKEGEEILSRVKTDPFVVALDEGGSGMESAALARFIEGHNLRGTKQLTFVVGGHGGLSEDVRRRADFCLSLSKMTLTHEMARLLLTEQVYRAYTILHDLPYQK